MPNDQIYEFLGFVTMSSLVISFWCVSLFYLMKTKRPFKTIRDYLLKKTENNSTMRALITPIVVCVSCMASVHGVLINLILYSLVIPVDPTLAIIVGVGFSIIMSSFLNYIFYQIYHIMQQYE